MHNFPSIIFLQIYAWLLNHFQRCHWYNGGHQSCRPYGGAKVAKNVVCKQSATSAPPIWQAQLVTPLFYFGYSKGIWQWMAFDDILTVGYFSTLTSDLKFSATYAPLIFDSMTGNLHFLFWIFNGDQTLTAYAKFNEFLPVGYFFNELYVLDVTVTLLKILLCLLINHDWMTSILLIKKNAYSWPANVDSR